MTGEYLVVQVDEEGSVQDLDSQSRQEPDA